MLSVSDKYDSVNERTQEISKSMKLRILGVWQNAHENLLGNWLNCTDIDNRIHNKYEKNAVKTETYKKNT